VRLDRLAGTVTGRPGLVRRLAQGGGTIPDRGYFQLRLDGSNAKLGELDEEFVWERSIGDGFVLGAQAWRIRTITAHEVFVAPARGGALLAPFWRADARDRDAYFSRRVGELLERAETRLDDPAFARELEREHGFEPEAAAELLRLLREQRAALGVPLPHRHHLVCEETPERAGDLDRRQVVLFTFWGGTVNRPLALALAALWEEREGEPLEALSDDDAVLLVLPAGADPRALLAALAPERIEELLRRRLEASGFFGALFRQNAQRALLLPRAAPNRRTPLWVSRQNAKRLLEAVSRFDDFPLLVETWRSCLQDEFELDVLRERLGELARGEIAVSRARGERPSPFAANLVWQRTNEQMYEDDVPATRRGAALRGDLVREVALAATERPRLPRRLVERFRRTAQRLLPGYPPRDADELVEWVKERLWIGRGEWRELLAAIDAERRGDPERPAAAELAAAAAPRLVEVEPPGGEPAIAALETALDVAGIPALAACFATAVAVVPPDVVGASEARERERLASFLGQWLRFHGPLPIAEVAARFALAEEAVAAAVERLVRGERAVRGTLLEGSEADEIASRSSFETLLRWRRAEGRREVETLPLARLPRLVGWQQGLVERQTGPEGLRRRLECLFGYPAAAGAWEREILPARLEAVPARLARRARRRDRSRLAGRRTRADHLCARRRPRAFRRRGRRGRGGKPDRRSARGRAARAAGGERLRPRVGRAGRGNRPLDGRGERVSLEPGVARPRPARVDAPVATGDPRRLPRRRAAGAAGRPVRRPRWQPAHGVPPVAGDADARRPLVPRRGSRARGGRCVGRRGA
jgi:ATP-dependent helicase Lhr and Lhr-like helicase